MIDENYYEIEELTFSLAGATTNLTIMNIWIEEHGRMAADYCKPYQLVHIFKITVRFYL